MNFDRFFVCGHSLSGCRCDTAVMKQIRTDREAMGHQEIITYMTERGWGYGERTVLNQVMVTFSRTEWHGRRLDRPFTVSSWGHRDYIDRMVREAGREALQVWHRFSDSVPRRYYDEERREVVWADVPLRGAGLRPSA